MQPPDPAQIARLYREALARLAAGDLDGAEARLRDVLAARPRQAEALFQMGRIAMTRGAPKRAARHFERAAEAQPAEPAIWLAWAQALAALADRTRIRSFQRKARAARLPAPVLARLQEALAPPATSPAQTLDALRRAAQARPDAAEPQIRLGQALLRARDFAAAADAFGRAIALGDNRAETHTAHARALDGSGQTEAALAAHDRAVSAAPDRPETHGRRAILLQQMGRFDEADAGFRRAIALAPRDGEPYRLMVKGRKLAADDPLIAEMETLWSAPDLGDHSRMNLGFALAKAMEDIRRDDRIFGYLHKANALMRKLYPYDIAERRAEIDAVRTAFAETDFTARRVPGTSGYAPVFVTGMPRSGTTLVEQIIASHSRVTGGGELGFVMPEAMRLMSDGAGGLRPVSALSDEEIAGFGHAIEAHFRMRLPGADIVTDKSIQTYMVAGLVQLALPNARIVVVHRDPRDTCLSIYKNIFAEGTHRYAYDLRDLGLYTRMFLELVDFWRERLPGGFHEIRYEDLIADPEPQARALIAAAGLDWEDGCLDFHKTERRVSTLSLHQVRQPIYASSLKGWQRHADELAPLIEALGDVIEQEGTE
ncbi:tetratricopeptide repeat-containing sulfotransferase family protein [Rhodovulum sp.]|uniref:tetratricopeptide repeat-containing sulfotransferase family protein n=1 Tax=Rhodovulum sp. TaxID=34009 RepID=UPI0017DACE86|nr:sulfotransferase [Rhodovulum sp.]HDR29155.1 tetratricopeptide repeat protein [Rhodovulum sp.]